jgi:hypothetical protein
MCRRRFRLSRRPGVIHCAVAQLLHHLLKVRREVAVGGDAIGRGERHAVRLDRGPDRFRGVPRAKPCGPLPARNRCARMRLGEYPIRRATTEVPPSPTHPTPQPTPFVAPYKLPGRGGSFASDCVVSGLAEMKSPITTTRRDIFVATGAGGSAYGPVLGLLRRQWDGTCCIGRRVSR